MATGKQILVEVVYARPDEQRIFPVWVEEGSTIETVIDRSGVLLEFPEIDLNKQKVGIFSQIRPLTAKVAEGDRIEIYRPLLIDPKEARRKRGKR